LIQMKEQSKGLTFPFNETCFLKLALIHSLTKLNISMASFQVRKITS
jgi:hypothetical protein